MSFRIEEKILFNKMQDNLLNKFLIDNKSKIIHESRIISSIYFDNKFFQMFKDSEEGCVPRKKIRLRTYSNKNIFSFEIKISSVEGRYKTTQNIKKKDYEKFIRCGVFDNIYGICYPVLKISYKRKYINVFSKRLTIDSDIKYQNFVTKKIIEDNHNKVMEIKTSIDEDLHKLNINFPFRRSRYSKYSEGVKKLKIKN